MSKTRVLVVEDQTMPRQLFAMLIAASEDFELAAAIDSADLADVYCLRNDVDLVLMDVMTRGGCTALEATGRIKSHTPQVRIVVVTSKPECSFMDRARAAGVESFWYKEAEGASILEVMRRTMAGESVYPDAAPELMLGCASSTGFTARELEVLREMTGGYTNTEIAGRLHLSVGSVKTHILSMLDKTGFRNRTELAVRARESGLVILEEHDGRL